MFESNHGTVTNRVDEAGFEWIPYGGCSPHNGEGYIRVYEKGRLFINADAGRAIEAMGQPTPDGYYKAAIGVAPKAIAIKLLDPNDVAVRLCPRKNHTYHCNSKGVIQRLKEAGIQFPLLLPCTVYETQKLLLCKLQEKPKGRR